MNLSDVVKVKEKRDIGVEVPWGEASDTPIFLISYTGKDSIKKARKTALTKKLNKKSHKFEDSIDDEIFDKELMGNALAGWKGLKAKHLKEILDPSSIELNIPEENMETEIECTDENKTMVLSYYNISFSRFISGVSSEVEVYRQYQEEQLMGNLQSSQVGLYQEV